MLTHRRSSADLALSNETCKNGYQGESTMKKRNAVKLAALALSAGAVSAPAVVHAQSSVTLYGILDAGITYVNNTGGSHVVKFDDGVSYGNRLGFKGVEDLGGGLKAVFVLESGFHLGNGTRAQGGAEFGRQAYVGVPNQWGTISAGNQPDMTNEFMEGYNISSLRTGYPLHHLHLTHLPAHRLLH